MAELVYKVSLATIFAALLVGGIIDFGFWLADRKTISLWLAADGHMDWFYWPASVMLVFLLVLGIHLEYLRR